MRTSHRQIRKRILEEADKISDEELFSSREFQAYMTDKIEAAGKRYQRPLGVTIYADSSDETIAYTDYNGIFINAANSLTRSFPTRKLRAISIEGLCGHENGHNLFTDNRIWKTHLQRLKKGRFYPRKPAGLDAVHKLYAGQLQQALLDKDDPVPACVVLQTAKTLENILEDGFVDTRYSCEFPGAPARGIALNNMRFAETVPDIAEMLSRKFYDHTIVLNLLIQYVRAGEVNNLSGYHGELLDTVVRYIPMIDGCLLDDDARARCKIVNQILVDLWPMMSRCFDDLRDQLQQNPSGGPSDTEAETVQQTLDNQLPRMRPNFMVDTEAVDPCAASDGAQLKAARVQAQRVLEEETGRLTPQVTHQISSSGEGSLKFDRNYAGAGYDHAGDDIARLLETMAEHRVQTKLEEALSAELQREAETIRYGNAHTGISVTVNRMTCVDQSLIEAYQQTAPELLPLSRRLQQRIRPMIQEKRQGGKQTGLYCGKKLDQRALYRRDGRCFCNTHLPAEPINMRVAWVIDESGSMSGMDRITRARAAAIVVYDFCTALGIPIMMIGHTALEGHVELFAYADFDSVDRLDRYRIMDMSARECNRDGAAIRFAAERLNREDAEVKLLFVITDGQPNDDAYTGTAAEADLRGIKLEYSRKGIRMYAAAIGEDRENIERIYGSGFLDITDLNDLPVMLTGVIARSLPL